MQTIYIDTLICVNLFVDFFILLAQKAIFRIHTKNYRCLLAAVIAAVSTLVLFLPFYTVAFSVIFRVVTAAVVVLAAFGYRGLKVFAVRTLSYLGVSIGFCGVMVLVWLVFKPDGVAIINDVVYFNIPPELLIGLTIICYGVITVFSKLSARRKIKTAVRRVGVEMNSDKVSFEAMVDTGCTLCEPFSGLPVILADNSIFDGIKPPDSNYRIIPYSTIDNQGYLCGFKPDRVTVDGRHMKDGCYVALTQLKLNNQAGAIIGTEISEAT